MPGSPEMPAPAVPFLCRVTGGGSAVFRGLSWSKDDTQEFVLFPGVTLTGTAGVAQPSPKGWQAPCSEGACEGPGRTRPQADAFLRGVGCRQHFQMQTTESTQAEIAGLGRAQVGGCHRCHILDITKLDKWVL